MVLILSDLDRLKQKPLGYADGGKTLLSAPSPPYKAETNEEFIVERWALSIPLFRMFFCAVNPSCQRLAGCGYLC
jgi:hypothetical protein